MYLFISSQRVAGCLITEPIKAAFKLVSNSVNENTDGNIKKKSRSQAATLQFGGTVLQREVIKKATSNSCKVVDGKQSGAIVCENEAIPAACGIRAIWVSPSNRRKGIASQLLDAVR